MTEDFDEEPEVAHDQRPPTVLGREALVEVSPRVWVLPDRDRTPHVPNVGIVVGDRAALVIESGTGIENGRRVLDIAREKAEGRRLYVTATHFHPEHGYGVQAFAETAIVIYNEIQRDELREKQDLFTERFSGFTEHLARALEGVRYVPPDIVYSERAALDLGGIVAELHHFGPAHTRGDQVVHLPAEGILFTGDLVEERFFCIMPDGDTRPNRWLSQLRRMRAWDPRVVVPGHGALGGPELIEAVIDSLQEVKDPVDRQVAQSIACEAIVAELEPQVLARHPDWGNREWVGRIIEQFYADAVGAGTRHPVEHR